MMAVGGDTETKSGTLRTVLSHRDFRYLFAGLGISYVGDWMYGVALLAYVFQETRSPAWVAAAAILRFIPYLVFSPFAGMLGDRYERRSVMLASDLVRATAMFSLAAVSALSGPVVLALAIVMVLTTASTPYQPALAAMTPSLVGEEDLAAANSALTVIENIGLALGPAIGGLLLYLGSPSVAFALNGITFLVSLAAVAAVETRSKASAEGEEEGFKERFFQGFRAVRGSADILIMLAVIAGSAVLYGQENVLLVLVAKDLLGTGSDGVGFLFAAIGVGGLLGAGVSTRLARDSRPGRWLALTLVLSGAALIGVAFTSVALVAYAFMTLDGAGAVILDVLAITMLQRTVSSDVMARVFGILMTLAVAAVLLGSVLAPILLNLFNLRIALVIAGGMLPLLALAVTPRLRALNRRSAEASSEIAPRLEVLRGLAIFNGAPAPILEALALNLEERRVATGDVVVRQGEPATDFYVVRSGALDVLSSGEAGERVETVNSLHAGDYFGEIGLLEKIPRTATVRATRACELLKMSGDDFLSAVNEAPGISRLVAGVVMGRLARTHPSHRPIAPTAAPVA
jgi:MFS family permease